MKKHTGLCCCGIGRFRTLGPVLRSGARQVHRIAAAGRCTAQIWRFSTHLFPITTVRSGSGSRDLRFPPHPRRSPTRGGRYYLRARRPADHTSQRRGQPLRPDDRRFRQRRHEHPAEGHHQAALGRRTDSQTSPTSRDWPASRVSDDVDGEQPAPGPRSEGSPVRAVSGARAGPQPLLARNLGVLYVPINHNDGTFGLRLTRHLFPVRPHRNSLLRRVILSSPSMDSGSLTPTTWPTISTRRSLTTSIREPTRCIKPASTYRQRAGRLPGSPLEAPVVRWPTWRATESAGNSSTTGKWVLR